MKKDTLFAEEIAKAGNRILCIFDKLVFGFVANVLYRSLINIIEGGDLFFLCDHTHHLFTTERDSTSNLTLTILVCDTLCQSFLKASDQYHVKRMVEHTTHTHLGEHSYRRVRVSKIDSNDGR